MQQRRHLHALFSNGFQSGNVRVFIDNRFRQVVISAKKKKKLKRTACRASCSVGRIDAHRHTEYQSDDDDHQPHHQPHQQTLTRTHTDTQTNALHRKVPLLDLEVNLSDRGVHSRQRRVVGALQRLRHFSAFDVQSDAVLPRVVVFVVVVVVVVVAQV